MNHFSMIKRTIFVLAGVLIISSSAVSLYKDREKILSKLSFVSHKGVEPQSIDADRKWAKKIMGGGFILHFRHAERDKWIDVQMYDVLESDLHDQGKNGTRFAENDYFGNAVCLNFRGKIQARAIGEHLKNIKLPIGYVISSPSCRSRQTAVLAFGGYKDLDRMLVHSGPYNENENTRVSSLRQIYLKLPRSKNKNTIVSAHNSVVHPDMFDNNIKRKLNLEEGGFYVISSDGKKLTLDYEFHNFNDFVKVFYPR